MKKNKNPIFLCAAIINNQITGLSIEAEDKQIASELFEKQIGQVPSQIYGPFAKARQPIIKHNTVLKFINNVPQKAIYKGWIVNAFQLADPINYAYLVFISKIAEEKNVITTGTIIIPTTELRFI